ncbi:hypothetical protein FOA52_005079 [Chlamydomonas sp. UWO 241]|nr:hypothetical protein FOA52_005079 [Chlamydomonas sp. UWO 241]
MLAVRTTSSAFASRGGSTRAVSRPLTVGPVRLGGVVVPGSSSCGLRTTPAARRVAPLRATDDKQPTVVYNKQFGYSRKDILLIGVGLGAFGYAAYYGLQATGVEPGMAGNFVQLGVFLGICVFWVSTYVYRVATKQMTYVKQLEQYEEAVMQKRVEEMTDEEMTEMINEVEREEAKQARGLGKR